MSFLFRKRYIILLDFLSVRNHKKLLFLFQINIKKIVSIRIFSTWVIWTTYAGKNYQYKSNRTTVATAFSFFSMQTVFTIKFVKIFEKLLMKKYDKMRKILCFLDYCFNFFVRDRLGKLAELFRIYTFFNDALFKTPQNLGSSTKRYFLSKVGYLNIEKWTWRPNT